jgi:hypothetical protein
MSTIVSLLRNADGAMFKNNLIFGKFPSFSDLLFQNLKAGHMSGCSTLSSPYTSFQDPIYNIASITPTSEV